MAKYTKIGNKYYAEQGVGNQLWSNVVPGKSGGYGTMLTEISPQEIQNRFGSPAFQADTFENNWKKLVSGGEAQELDPSQAQDFFNQLASHNVYVPATIPQNTETVAGNPLQPGRYTPASQTGAIGGPPGTQTDITGGTTGTTSTPSYRDAQGNVYDAQGNHLTMDQIPKDASGRPSVNLETLPLKTAGAGGTAGTTGQQVSRDAQGNFFVNGKHITLDQFKQLGINADFVPPGQTVSLQQAQTGTPTTGATGATGAFDPSVLSSLGITADQYNALNPLAQSMVQSLWVQSQAAYQKGQIDYSLNAKALNDALLAAQNDPNIIAKYGDQLQTATIGLSQNLANLSADYAQQQGLTSIQQQLEQKNLAEQQAAAGTAYSGFRQQAQQQLSQQQTAVIESSRRALQQSLQSLGQPLEQTYGTKGLTKFSPITAGGLSYTPYGNITGTIGAQKQADIQARQQQIFSAERPIQ